MAEPEPGPSLDPQTAAAWSLRSLASGRRSRSFLLFLLATAAVYVLSAVDAYRVAAGDQPLVSSRTLLWSSAALVVLLFRPDRELRHLAGRPPVASGG